MTNNKIWDIYIYKNIVNLIKKTCYTENTWMILLGGEVKSSDKFHPNEKKLNQKTISIIIQWLDLNVSYVEAEINSHKMWQKFKDSHELKNVQINFFYM